MKNQTISVKAGIESDTQYGAVMPPIYLSVIILLKIWENLEPMTIQDPVTQLEIY